MPLDSHNLSISATLHLKNMSAKLDPEATGSVSCVSLSSFSSSSCINPTSSAISDLYHHGTQTISIVSHLRIIARHVTSMLQVSGSKSGS